MRPFSTRRYYLRHMREDLVDRVRILSVLRKETMEEVFNRGSRLGWSGSLSTRATPLN